MQQKVDDLASKLGNKALSRAAGDLVQLKSEANYLERQVDQSRSNEAKLLDICQKVYRKLEQQNEKKPTGQYADPELRQINRTLREILTKRTLWLLQQAVW